MWTERCFQEVEDLTVWQRQFVIDLRTTVQIYKMLLCERVSIAKLCIMKCIPELTVAWRIIYKYWLTKRAQTSHKTMHLLMPVLLMHLYSLYLPGTFTSRSTDCSQHGAMLLLDKSWPFLSSQLTSYYRYPLFNILVKQATHSLSFSL